MLRLKGTLQYNYRYCNYITNTNRLFTVSAMTFKQPLPIPNSCGCSSCIPILEKQLQIHGKYNIKINLMT